MENKYFNKALLVLMFLMSSWLLSQTIASSEGTTLCSNCTPNANWTTVTGTPDVSNRTTAATTATTGGGATWNSSPLPIPPNNHNFFITLRDIGTVAGEEAIRVTMSGLTVGREYEVLVYTLSATAPAYSPTFIDAFAYQLEGASRINITQTVATRNIWVTRRLRFIASATTRTLTFYPGSNASTSSFESINISVTANAINAVPIAADDNTTTLQNTPVTINVAANDTDPDGSVVANTVRFTGGQTSVVTTQGTWSVNTTTGQVTFTPVTGFVGMATIPYTIQDNYTLNGVSSPSTSSNAFISVIVKADTDGDGITNDIDLDDDNDGILDSVECPETNAVTNGTFTTNLNGWTNSGGWAFVGGTAENTTDNAVNQTLSQSLPNLDKPYNGVVSLTLTVGAQDGTNAAGNTASLDILLNNVVYATLNNSTVRTVGVNNVTMTMANGAVSDFTPFSTASQTGFTTRTFTINIPYTGPATATLAFRMNATQDDWSLDNISLPVALCDTDNDGIPNHLDLDSDNDGCFDAIEGDENVTLSQINANGSINTTANGGVNANGVPNLVNTSGAADIGSDVGQGIGTSQNSTLQDVQCANAFGCTTAMYLSQTATLFNVDTTTNPFTYPAVGTASVTYNAIGLNPLDGRLYGMQVSSPNVLVINTNGTSINLGPVTGLPTGVIFNAGEIDNLGNYYVKVNSDNNQIYRINLNTMTATTITLSTSINVADLAYNVTTGLLYTVNSPNGQLVSINPTTGVVTPIGSAPGAISFGAMFGSSTGELYGADNAGGFYQFNITNGQRVLISGSPSSNANDGAHCVTAPITFSSDLAVTKTNGVTTYSSGTTTTYTIVVRNNGPFGVLGATVSDPVPSGIPSANVSYTAVTAGGATTSVTGTQTGAINDVVSLPVGATVTYTVVVSIPFSFNGNLVNTVTVTPPVNITDTNSANNTATDTDTQAVCYRPAVTAGTVLDTSHGITSLNRAGNSASGNNWPMVRKGAWTALESKTKGFVLNRLSTAQIAAIPSVDLVEGMMVYNTTLDCLQVNTTGTPAGWACFNTQTCPTN
ncbi:MULTISPECIES: beta strand repeat-containing protein [Chryseobacterium]|uniref:CshA-type fibril repeat n=1 Tax=Chryseobacterium taihuense TaxID=1141221 RepID=A0A4U8WF50_9FLAO|nr:MULTISPECIES: Ig-like domain-containing protein [Chryseobacterium]QQV01922.1 hypothetical protein I6I61_12630 [Chryseobacterium sp. FDAARGOS 1104]VFB04853.1 CshA-type fibril repeat [Chryseobacterium taihuense]